MAGSYLNDDFFSRLETLALNLRADLSGYFGGKHLVKTYGQTVEFADFREYMLGDDIRRIDWNLYSRFEKFYIKLFSDERQMRVSLFLDCSASMGRENPKKSAYAVGVAAALGFLAVHNTDKVSFKLMKGNVCEDPFGVIVGKKTFFNAVGTLENLEFDGDMEVPSYTPVEIQPNDTPFFMLRRDLIKFKREATKLSDWKDRQLVLMIDEFTLCYSLIEEGKLAPEFLQQWKAFSQEGDTALSAVLIGQDVVPAFKSKDYARNAFGVIEDQRLTYLDTLSAAALITQPTADSLRNGASRFLGNSAQRLLRLTSRNPYFIQFACMKLVNWMNAHKLSVVTEADIDDLTHDLLQGNNRVGLQNFDSLLRESEKDDGPYKEADELCVLRRIAALCGPEDYCRTEDIAGCGIENWADIVQYLTNRDVLENGVADTVRIQVGLFQQWLTTN